MSTVCADPSSTSLPRYMLATQSASAQAKAGSWAMRTGSILSQGSKAAGQRGGKRSPGSCLRVGRVAWLASGIPTLPSTVLLPQH